ncbi:hypothetical protein CRG98_000669 [Punica granatum]|uniref:Uncharacterized protein n=1 Tax=Punica granatum TaxID=22663 RepID=A0A2I0LE23_PUNGR|nr:hypothetical protein CRG98_000669 [Punica granatum]
MASGDSFSHAFVAHPREGGHSQAALLRPRAHVPRRDEIREPTRFRKRETALAPGKPRELTGLSLETRPLRVSDLRGRQPRQLGRKWVGTLAPATARCEIEFVGLLGDGSRRSWVVPNVPSPR